jgi:hypothetical protein
VTPTTATTTATPAATPEETDTHGMGIVLALTGLAAAYLYRKNK